MSSFIGAIRATAVSANAALVQWQAEVGNGTTASATEFTTVSAPGTINVGALSGATSFEFIVNAGGTGVAHALLATSNQSLRFEQFNNTGNYGITIPGVADINSGVAHTANTDTHLVFASDGTDTLLYVNGTLANTFTGTALTITGSSAIASNFGGGDNLDGNILGFAAYDAQLSAVEVTTHANAFASAAVPEPSSTALLGLGGLALILRRRK